MRIYISYGKWQEQKQFQEPALALDGAADHFDFRDDDDYYTQQPGNLFRIMTTIEQQQVLFENTARSLGDAEKFIQERHIQNCYKADPNYGKGVAAALNIKLADYANNASDLTAASHVVAVHFQTISTANNFWKK